MGSKPEGFDRIFEEFFRPLCSFFRRRGAGLEDSRDLAQETLLKVFRGLGSFRRDSSFKTWVYSIARNTWANSLRRAAASKRDAPETSLQLLEEGGQAQFSEGWSDASSADDPLNLLLEEEQVRQVEDHIDNLPPQMRRCLELRLRQGRKYREIAKILGISIETVKSQLHQARRRLRSQLSPP